MYFEVTKKEPKVSSLLPFFLSPTFLALVAATAVIILNILLIILFSRRIRNKRNYRYFLQGVQKMHNENPNKWGQCLLKPGIHNTTNEKKLPKEFWEIKSLVWHLIDHAIAWEPVCLPRLTFVAVMLKPTVFTFYRSWVTVLQITYFVLFKLMLIQGL